MIRQTGERIALNTPIQGSSADIIKKAMIDLYEKMKWIIENKRKSQEIAKSGQEYMVENMSSERNADEIYELYKRLLKH